MTPEVYRHHLCVQNNFLSTIRSFPITARFKLLEYELDCYDKSDDTDNPKTITLREHLLQSTSENGDRLIMSIEETTRTKSDGRYW